MVSEIKNIKQRSGLWRVNELELKYIKEAIENGLTGKYVNIFEEKFAALVGTKYAIAVNSGTSALHAAMLALEIGPDDEVIVPPLTFVATAYAPMYVGAKPIFADIDQRTLTIDPKAIEARITEKTKAIITVSLYGLMPEMDEIKKIAQKNNLFIIEDNAQCVLGKYKSRSESSFGDISIYSFQRSKHLTSGDGGVVVTNNEEYAEKVRKYADLGYRLLTAKPTTNENFKDQIQRPDFKRHELVGYNFRMPEVCAAMGVAQVEKARYLVQMRQRIASFYADVVKDFSFVIPQFVPEHIEHTYWAYTFILDTSIASWEKFREVFINLGGKTFYGAWSLSYLEPSMLNFNQSNCSVAETIQSSLVQLKTNFESIEEGRYQANVLRQTLMYFEAQ